MPRLAAPRTQDLGHAEALVWVCGFLHQQYNKHSDLNPSLEFESFLVWFRSISMDFVASISFNLFTWAVFIIIMNKELGKENLFKIGP